MIHMSGVVVVYDDGEGVAETGVTVGSSDISSDIIILKIYILNIIRFTNTKTSSMPYSNSMSFNIF